MRGATDGWLRTADGEGMPDARGAGARPRRRIRFPAAPVARGLRRARTLPIDFQWLRSPWPDELFSLTARPGHLRLFGRETIGSLFTQALVARRQQAHCYSARPASSSSREHFQQMAGLVCYYNSAKFHYLYVIARRGGRQAPARHVGAARSGRRRTPSRRRFRFPPASRSNCASKSTTSACASPIGSTAATWTWLPQQFDASILSDEATAPGLPNFTGAFVGMACQDLAGTALPADFDWFEYRERDYVAEATSETSCSDNVRRNVTNCSRSTTVRGGLMFGVGGFASKSRGALVVVVVTVALLEAQGPTPLYRQANAPVDARVGDLLARMTLEEKVAQLQGIWNRKREIQDAQGRFDPAKAQALLGYGIGEVSRPSEIAGRPADRPAAPPRARASSSNAVQKWLIENTRLGIPAMFHEEALHGLAAPGGTHFPVPIGLASTWDPALVERVMSVAALEGARARRAARALAGRRSRTRSALGPHRGDLRRGSVSRHADGRRRGPRLSGHSAAARRRTRSSRR